MLKRIRRMWCIILHRGAMLPIHGRYLCPKCLIEHICEWERKSV
jgi:hypothetical protein